MTREIKKKYKILRAQAWSDNDEQPFGDLEEQVNESLLDGWTTQGGLCVTKGYQLNFFYQAMTRKIIKITK